MTRAAAVTICVLAPCIAAACPDRDDVTTLTAATEAAPPAYVVIGDLPVSAPFDITLLFCDAPEVTYVIFDATMPAHQHGMNYIPDIQNTGSGKFAIRDVVFHMPGIWQLNITAQTSNENHAYMVEVLVE